MCNEFHQGWYRTVRRAQVTSSASSYSEHANCFSEGMATITYIGELISALMYFVLLIWRLVEHDFLDRDATLISNVRKNVLRLYAFYVMALLEAFIFLVEKTYWEYKTSYEKLFTKVDKKAGLKGECIDTIRSFFEVYSTSLAFSVFTGFEMELLSYCMELLQSDDVEELSTGWHKDSQDVCGA